MLVQIFEIYEEIHTDIVTINDIFSLFLNNLKWEHWNNFQTVFISSHHIARS